LNRTGFNGLCRFNAKGEFNVPIGRYKTINYTFDFVKYKKPLQNWEFWAGDFSQVQIQTDDFIYADPPYDVEFTTYSPGGFSWNDQVRLANWLDTHIGPVVTSNQATDRIINLYRQKGFEIIILDAPRKISSNGDRTPASEMLAIKNV
jgi:DNA adenine methylase